MLADAQASVGESIGHTVNGSLLQTIAA